MYASPRQKSMSAISKLLQTVQHATAPRSGQARMSQREEAGVQWHMLYEFPLSSDKKPRELSCAMYSGCSDMNSFVVSQSVGIVCQYSVNAMVKPVQQP